MLVAYVRAIGASVSAGQAFHGPMAKPQRMFVVMVAALYCGLAPAAWQPEHASSGFSVMSVVLVIIIAGGAITALRRLLHIGRRLRSPNS